MLSARHKAQILARAGFKVPPYPAPPRFGAALRSQQGKASADRQHRAADEVGEPDSAWRRQIDILYSQYAAERAARSLHEAEESRQLASIRRASDT